MVRSILGVHDAPKSTLLQREHHRTSNAERYSLSRKPTTKLIPLSIHLLIGFGPLGLMRRRASLANACELREFPLLGINRYPVLRPSTKFEG
jgi:hypothetical protein